MSEYMFGTFRPGRPLPMKLQKQVENICKKHGGWGLNGGNIPGQGWLYWFVAPNRGEPFDRELRDVVLGELKQKGIAWGE